MSQNSVEWDTQIGAEPFDLLPLPGLGIHGVYKHRMACRKDGSCLVFQYLVNAVAGLVRVGAGGQMLQPGHTGQRLALKIASQVHRSW